MKLYATTTSERASKGQGGKWLDVKITDENKKTLLDLHLDYFEGDKLRAVVYTSHRVISKEFSDMYNAKPLGEKGEKQKGEIAQQLKEDREKDTFNSGMQ